MCCKVSSNLNRTDINFIIINNCFKTGAREQMPAEKALKQLGKLMTKSHESLKTLYECSHPELDKLVALSDGIALGCRLTGAGLQSPTLSLPDQPAGSQLARSCFKLVGFGPDQYSVYRLYLTWFPLGLNPPSTSWGGCVVALTTKDTVESYIKILKESFYETNSATKGKDLNMFVFATEPSGGAQIIRAIISRGNERTPVYGRLLTGY
uniref:GHMP kinase C-terminal domain-containing protein n=1 Tax=Timema bartmani TaxID=61472 RepID=A0A7R9EZI4_9NEOP|nr:unnamed protein product [Timema bartmani]